MASARHDELDALSQWSKGRSSQFTAVLAFGGSQRPGTKGSLGKLQLRSNPNATQESGDDQQNESLDKSSPADEQSWGPADQSPAVAGPSNTNKASSTAAWDTQDGVTSEEAAPSPEPAGDATDTLEDDAEALAEQLLQQKDTGFDVQVDFVSFPEFDSCIEIKVRQFWPHPTKPGKQKSRVAKIMLYRDSVSGPLTFSGFANNAREWASRFEVPVSDMFKLNTAARTYGQRLWEITIPYLPVGTSLQNVYSVNDEGSEDTIWGRLRRSLAEPGELKILVHAEGVNKTVEGMNSEFEELRAADPTDAWFPDARRKFIQPGMIVGKDDRPQVKLGEHNTFPDFDRYLLVAGHACVGEQDCVVTESQPFCAPLRVLELPGSSGSVYFGFICDLPEGRRLNSGDTMRVHPKDATCEIDDDSAWSAQAIDPLPFASLSDTSIILYRSHPDNIWDDLDMGDITKVESLKTFQDALSAVTNAPAETATFRVDTSEKVFKKQIAALRQLTDNKNGTYNCERELLLANHPSLL
ncbi:hypothetical protein SLS58_010766 [Diplodia intermedia]|uniref:Protection of telomeres protein 1 n=1 Tax=Diplodia intermedia TaxID=856260 RepID=A0ABR3T553_9PEZI